MVSVGLGLLQAGCRVDLGFTGLVSGGLWYAVGLG